MKSLNALLVGIFTILILAVAVNAATSSLSITKIQDLTLTQNGTFTVKNTGDTTLTNIEVTSAGDFVAAFAPSSQIGTLNPGQNSTVISVYPTKKTEDLKFGTNAITVTAKDGANSVQATADFSLTKTFCRSGAVGENLSLTRVKINSDGDNNDEWKLLDTVTVDVKVRNDGDSSIKDVFVDLGLFDDNGVNRINDVDFISTDDDSVSVGSISKRSDETVTFEFKVPADMITGNYRLAVKAYSDDSGEDQDCADTNSNLDGNFYQNIDVNTQDDKQRFIAVENIDVPSQSICGATISGSMELFNVGDEDQDQVIVAITSPQLGIDQEVEVKSNIDQGESREASFTIQLPSNVKDGTYTINFVPSYDYRNGVYREESQDTFSTPITLIGCNFQNIGNSNNPVIISASLGSTVKAGENLVVTSTLKNTGSEAVTVSVDASGFESWASLNSISKRSVTIQPGQSESVTLTFAVDSGASGTENFIIEATSNGVTESQQVEVKFPESTGTGFNLPSLTSGSGLIWVIAIVNVVLILLIIFAVVKIARR